MSDEEEDEFRYQLTQNSSHAFLLIIPGQEKLLATEKIVELTRGLSTQNYLLFDPFEKICISGLQDQRILDLIKGDKFKHSEIYKLFNTFSLCLILYCLNDILHLDRIKQDIINGTFEEKISERERKFEHLMPECYKVLKSFCANEISFEELASKIPLKERKCLMHPVLAKKMETIIGDGSNFSFTDKDVNAILNPLQDGQYNKVLRRLCAVGQYKLLKEILPGYVELLGMDVDEKNNTGFSAVDYALKYYQKHPHQKHAKKCYQFVLGYSKQKLLDKKEDCLTRVKPKF